MKWLNRHKNEVTVAESIMYADVPGIRVCVHQIHGIAGWYLNCSELRLSDVNSRTNNFQERTEQAKATIREEFEKLEASVNKFLEN